MNPSANAAADGSPALGQATERSGPGERSWFLICGVVAVLLLGLTISAVGAIAWRSSQRAHDRQQFSSTAANVTATLGTLLHRDTDFVATLRGVLTMQPRMSASDFNAWYGTLEGSSRQVGGIGSVVISSVPASQLSAFEAKRDADPAFRALLGRWLTPVARQGERRYCLMSAGGELFAITSVTAGLVQQDWCLPSSVTGSFQARLLQEATESRQQLALPINIAWLHTLFLETAFYKPGLPLRTPSERRAAVRGWLVSSFDASTLINAALGRNRGLALTVYHANPGQAPVLVGSSNAGSRAGGFTHTTALAIDGDWTVRVSGQPTVSAVSANTVGVLVFAAGTLVTLLLAALMLVLARSRDRALQLVAEKTRQLRHQALHDSLTDLPNRVLALDRGAQLLAHARREHRAVAALYVDVDGFKHVNDTFGHAAGDAVLRKVAQRLQSVTRDGDTAARLAGDEFVVLLGPSEHDADPEIVAERILELLCQPYDMNAVIERHLTLTVSIGLAYGIECSAEELLADADMALYVAKSSGKNRYVVFQSEMQTAAQDRMTLEMDLAEALDREELFLVYQPIFDLRTERPIAVEALLRWQHRERDLITPDVFIPIAEESGLIVPIGRWVLEQACRHTAQWRRSDPQLSVAVNVSARQLDSDRMLEDVRLALLNSGLDAGALTLEVTETTLMRDPHASARRLAALKDLGVRVAIDDFGTGYSSLAYLREFPVDALKIDRSFVGTMGASPGTATLVETLVKLGTNLGLETIAEGIEERAQLEMLRSQGCQVAQGFLLCRPRPAEDIESVLLDASTTYDAA